MRVCLLVSTDKCLVCLSLEMDEGEEFLDVLEMFFGAYYVIAIRVEVMMGLPVVRLDEFGKHVAYS